MCKWCEDCGFKLSSTKSAAVLFTRKHNPEPISLRLQDGTLKNQYKYLELTFQRNGSYSMHVQKVVAKCRARLNVIRMLKGTSWGAGKRSLLTVYRSLVRSVIVYGMEAYFLASPNLLKPLQKIRNDAMRFCTGALVSIPVICLHYACNEMPLNIKHKLLCLKFKAHLLSFSDHPGLSLTEDCWEELFRDSPGFCSFNMFTKTEVDHSIFASAPVHIPNIPPWLIRKAVIDLTLKAASHRIRLRLMIRLMVKGSLPTCSKNAITDNTGNPAYLKQFEVSWKPFETEKIHPDKANGACVKAAVGHKPDGKP